MNISLDLDLRDRLCSIRDQGDRPTCLSHAISTCHEFARGRPEALSSEYLHYFATDGKPNTASTIEGARFALKEHGQPEEEHCRQFRGHVPSDWKPSHGFPLFRRHSSVIEPKFELLKASLMQSRLPVLGIQLTKSFFHPAPPWIITPGELIHAYHAVIAVGFGSIGESAIVLIRNSWGSDWGENGHAFLSTNYLLRYLKCVLLLEEEVTSG